MMQSYIAEMDQDLKVPNNKEPPYGKPLEVHLVGCKIRRASAVYSINEDEKIDQEFNLKELKDDDYDKGKDATVVVKLIEDVENCDCEKNNEEEINSIKDEDAKSCDSVHSSPPSISEDERHEGKDIKLIEQNQLRFNLYRIFGICLIKRKIISHTSSEDNIANSDKSEDPVEYSKYEKWSDVPNYLIWFTWTIFGIIGCCILKTFLCIDDEKDSAYVYREAMFFTSAFIVIPGFETVILFRNNKHLPNIFNEISKIDSLELGREDLSVSICTWLKDHLKKDYLMVINLIVTSICSCGAICFWILMDCRTQVMSDITYYNVTEFKIETVSNIFDEKVKLWHLFGSIFALVFPSLTSSFCLCLVDHHRKLYMDLNHLFYETKQGAQKESESEIQIPTERIFTVRRFQDKEQLRKISKYLLHAQTIFGKLKKYLFRLTFGINFLVFVMNSLFCIKKLLTSWKNLLYFLWPLLWSFWYLWYIVHRSTKLITQHIKFKLNIHRVLVSSLWEDMEYNKETRALKELRKSLYLATITRTPQVDVYGGFTINYRMLTTMLLFSFVYANTFRRL